MMTEEKLTEVELLDLLAEMRQRDSGPPAEAKTFPHPAGLKFSRAWQLAQDPSGMTEVEQSHLKGCRRCAHLLKSTKAEWLIVSGSDEPLAPQKSAELLSLGNTAGKFSATGGNPMEQLENTLRGKLSAHELPNPDQPALPKHFRNVKVIQGWNREAARDTRHQANWDRRIRAFGNDVSPYLVSLLEKAVSVGVSWGETTAAAIGKLTLPDPSRRSCPIVCVATVGGAVGELHANADNSASILANTLAEALNGDSDNAITLHGVPAFISYPKDRAKVDVIQDFIANLENHRAIVDRGGNNGRANRLGAILTSCGNAGQGKFWEKELLRMGIDTATFARLTFGDIGGVLLKKPDLSPGDETLFGDIESRWTGITRGHYEKCALRNPGVILLALAANKAEIVLKCVELGLVSELIIDSDLAWAINDKIP